MLNYTFELNSDDLFKDIIFSTFCQNNINCVWVLGRPFLIKYNFTYDIAVRTVGMFLGKKN